MEKKTASRIMLTLLLISMLTLAFNVQPAKASETIYIRADGSVDPLTALIQRDGDVYTFTDNIYDYIVVERSNIIIDGAGYTLQGSGVGDGFYLSGINNVTIKRTNIERFGAGFNIYNSYYNIISGNNITNNWRGIYLYSSSNNTLRNNSMSGNQLNLYVDGWELSDFIQDIDSSNTVDGKPVYYWVNQQNRIVPDSAGWVALVNSTNITTKDLDLKNSGQGLLLVCTNNSLITDNKIAINDYGIDLLWAFNNTISRNNVTNSGGYGILLYYSSNNTISRNNVTNSGSDGIGLLEGSDNTISRNNITANNSNGILVYGSSNNSISRNNITNNNGVGIYLSGSLNNSIYENSITKNNWHGIELEDSPNNTICRNCIANNLVGILLYYYCSNNNIFGNNIIGNIIGVYIGRWRSNNNMIYHNNFISNSKQVSGYKLLNVWDDGYPSGGNYWSDYTIRYPNAQERDDSGIWDTPYVIDEYNKDNYPLMEPWTPTPPVIMTTVDVDPDTLNLRSKGRWITAYIQLPEAYSAVNINATTILLNGTISPVLDPEYSFVTNSSEYLVDHNNDGILERMVKFDRAMVESFIYTQGIRYGNVALTLTGNLFDETPFEGTDIIFVNYAGDANNDGTINIIDLSVVSAHWSGPPTGPLGYDVNADFNNDETVNILDVGILSANWGQTVP